MYPTRSKSKTEPTVCMEAKRVVVFGGPCPVLSLKSVHADGISERDPSGSVSVNSCTPLRHLESKALILVPKNIFPPRINRVYGRSFMSCIDMPLGRINRVPGEIVHEYNHLVTYINA